MQYRFGAKIDDYEHENKFSVSISKLRYLAAYVGERANACTLFDGVRMYLGNDGTNSNDEQHIGIQYVGCANKWRVPYTRGSLLEYH